MESLLPWTYSLGGICHDLSAMNEMMKATLVKQGVPGSLEERPKLANHKRDVLRSK